MSANRYVFVMNRFITLAFVGLIAVPSVGNTCTSLVYKDENGAAYAGRTMELPMQLPYEITYFPAGMKFDSYVSGHPELYFSAKHSFISVTVPDPVTKNLKVVEGVNDAGMSFSLLAFPGADGPRDMIDKTTAVLAAIDLGAWTLSNFKTVEEVKNALNKQPAFVTALLPMGLLKTPFHYTLHDASGHSVVIEYSRGKQNIFDNPIGVMTNGPEFQWHQTNLNNYTYMNNKDKSSLTINGVNLKQPDSGIATVALPASNTSTGRFIRAVYYSHFAEKTNNSDSAILMLSHIMNNFDRPRGITIDERFESGVENVAAPSVTGDLLYISEYTSWTALSDLEQRKFYIRSVNSMNYISFDLNKLKEYKFKITAPLNMFSESSGDVTGKFRSVDIK